MNYILDKVITGVTLFIIHTLIVAFCRLIIPRQPKSDSSSDLSVRRKEK